MGVRLNLAAIEVALRRVEDDWADIDVELQRRGIGRKDPFTSVVRANMLRAYHFLDELVAAQVQPISAAGAAAMLELNNRVHYGMDAALRDEFSKAIAANGAKFAKNVGPILGWCEKHVARGDAAYKLAAEVYVSILGQPQLFIEGNHRTGSLIASWINLAADCPPFVHFADRSTWRRAGQTPEISQGVPRILAAARRCQVLAADGAAEREGLTSVTTTSSTHRIPRGHTNLPAQR
jgi:hypothetical protein